MGLAITIWFVQLRSCQNMDEGGLVDYSSVASGLLYYVTFIDICCS